MCVFFLVLIYPSAVFSLCAIYHMRFFSHALIYIIFFMRFFPERFFPTCFLPVRFFSVTLAYHLSYLKTATYFPILELECCVFLHCNLQYLYQHALFLRFFFYFDLSFFFWRKSEDFFQF